MRKQPIINKCIAFILLLVFITGSAPKAFFHDLIADHEDLAGCSLKHEGVVLHQHEDHCDFDDLVVPVPFYFEKSLPVFLVAGYQVPVLLYSSSAIYPGLLQHKENRGPPAA